MIYIIEISSNYKRYETDDLEELLRILIKEIVILERKDKVNYKYESCGSVSYFV